MTTSVMWLLTSWHAIVVLILLYTCPVHAYRLSDFPNCNRCTLVMGDIGASTRAIIGNMNAALRKFCKSYKNSMEACFAAEDLTINALKSSLIRSFWKLLQVQISLL